MTDLEITKLCAQAMGIAYNEFGESELVSVTDKSQPYILNRIDWKPLRDDAQAMALIKKFWMVINPPLRDTRAKHKHWYANIPDTTDHSVMNADLNRAICECVAKMQSNKP